MGVRALNWHSRAIELYPEFPKPYQGRGDTYYSLQRYDEAIADYREYERLTGRLEPYMDERIKEMEEALSE